MSMFQSHGKHEETSFWSSSKLYGYRSRYTLRMGTRLPPQSFPPQSFPLSPLHHPKVGGGINGLHLMPLDRLVGFR